MITYKPPFLASSRKTGLNGKEALGALFIYAENKESW